MEHQLQLIIFNRDIDSSAYENLKSTPRPGHGDYTWKSRYGVYDYRGGGRGSGRITIGHVIGGAVAKKLLDTLKIRVISHVTQVGTVQANKIEPEEIERNGMKIRLDVQIQRQHPVWKH